MDNKITTPDNIKKYLSGVFETELNIYIMRNTIKKMEAKSNTLGHYRRLKQPQLEKEELDLITEMEMVGFLTGVAVAIIGGIIVLICDGFGFFEIIIAIILGLLVGVGGFIGGGLILGPIHYFFRRKHIEKEYQEALQQQAIERERYIRKQEARVRLEEEQDSALQSEIYSLNRRLEDSKKHLKEIYSYNIIAPEYRNIYAVGTILGYFEKGRTKSLGFNEKTGDQGAYNLYENERRLNKIITNTDEILRRMDEVLYNQFTLGNGLKEASKRIDRLFEQTNHHLLSIKRSTENVERCNEIIAYNSECANNELAFMNWMHCLGY